jgi:hypothetical protein
MYLIEDEMTIEKQIYYLYHCLAVFLCFVIGFEVSSISSTPYKRVDC